MRPSGRTEKAPERDPFQHDDVFAHHRFEPRQELGDLRLRIDALLIGFVMQLAQTRIGLSPYARLFVATGILGGYTTFSAFAYETYLLSRDAFSLQSLWYGFGSVIAGVAAAFVGIVIARAGFP